MSKICIVSDIHLGVRNNSPFFIKEMEKFFEDVFFPYIDEHKIKCVLNLGDVFDKRPTLNYVVFSEGKKFLFDELNKRDLRNIFLVGNHDCPFRHSNHPNSVRLLVDNNHYSSFEVYDEPSEIEIDGVKICLIPWVNSENQTETKRLIESTKAKFLFGHLEIIGFQMLKGIKAESGFDRNYLGKFNKVFSGHFHHRSSEDNIHYVGNPLETTWSDYGNKKGFHIFDLETEELNFIENPFTSHIVINNIDDVTESKIGNKIVKIDLTDKDNLVKESIYKKLDSLKIQPHSWQAVDHSDFKSRTENIEIEDGSIKTTQELIGEYVKLSSLTKKDEIENYLMTLHNKALEV